MMEEGNGRNWSDLTDITSKLLKEKRRLTCQSVYIFFVQLCARAKLLQSCPALCDPMDPMDCQALLFMEFSRQEYWSGLPCPPLGDLPHPGMEPVFPALQVDSLPLSQALFSHMEARCA